MGWSRANTWDTDRAKSIAQEIADVGGYCGPAVVAWIAAVWNLDKGRSYDYTTRLKDKSLFPNGPRNFFRGGDIPKWQTSLNAILKRETHDDLQLSDDTYYRYGTIHDELEDHDMPIIIRMKGRAFVDQLHYVTLYKSEKNVRDWKTDLIQFYWQDNGVYGRDDKGNSGLYKDNWRNVGTGFFTFGAKRVVKA